MVHRFETETMIIVRYFRRNQWRVLAVTCILCTNPPLCTIGFTEVALDLFRKNVVQPSKVEVKLVETVENELQSKVEVKPQVEPAENEPPKENKLSVLTGL